MEKDIIPFHPTCSEVRQSFRKALIGAGALLLLAYLLVSRSFWFADLERQVQVGKDRLNKPVDLTQAQTITWKIDGDEWKYLGECQIALLLDRVATIPAESYRKSSMALKVRVDAYAMTYEPSKNGRQSGLRADRLIKNGYYTTDLPLSPEARIWTTSAQPFVELGLGGAHRYAFEDTYLVLEVLQPDPVLAAANPRLQIFGEHDAGVYSHIWQLRIIRDAVLILLGCCVIGLAYGAWSRLP